MIDLQTVDNETKNLLRALCAMWNQYCGKHGHDCMSAGEECSAILQDYGLLEGEFGYADEDKLYN